MADGAPTSAWNALDDIPSTSASEGGDAPRETITVSVRRGANAKERHLSFKRPANISAARLLQCGLAIDGNQAVFPISTATNRHTGTLVYWYPIFETDDEGSAVYRGADNLPDALRATEVALVAFLGQYGYDVDFA